MTSITLLNISHIDGSVTFVVDGVLYEYTFPLNDHIRKVTVINKKSGLAALNYAKRWAMRTRRLETA